MAGKYKIIDTTLREGEQTPGVSFTLEEKKNIIKGLSKIGVAEIEIGISSPFMEYMDELVLYCRSHFPELCTSLWSRCRVDDISYAATLKPDILSLSIPVSDIHLESRLGKDREWAQSRLYDSINFACGMGLKVSVGFEDATRADIQFLMKMAVLASRHGAERIRLADTVGISSPGKLAHLVRLMKNNIHSGCDVAIHTHNDFGMATANAVAALEAGATWADATILGLGERAGCARLEELVGYLVMRTEGCGMSTHHLKELSAYVASIISMTIEPARPIIGDRIFTCETGLHIQGLQKNPKTYDPYPPENVGAERRLLFGAKIGCRAVAVRLSQLGYKIDANLIIPHIRSIRARALASGTPLTDDELIASVMKPHWF
ncbi:MAG: hypothetical protein HQK67_01560 [Desulfamplus sp.]|nr:hypothetical protein [Desulfamplus sp.]